MEEQAPVEQKQPEKKKEPVEEKIEIVEEDIVEAPTKMGKTSGHGRHNRWIGGYPPR